MIEIGKKYRLKKLKGWFEKDSEEFTVLCFGEHMGIKRSTLKVLKIFEDGSGKELNDYIWSLEGKCEKVSKINAGLILQYCRFMVLSWLRDSSIGLYCRNFVHRSRAKRAIFFESALSVLGARRDSSPKSLMSLGLTALTKIPALVSQEAIGS